MGWCTVRWLIRNTPHTRQIHNRKRMKHLHKKRPNKEHTKTRTHARIAKVKHESANAWNFGQFIRAAAHHRVSKSVSSFFAAQTRQNTHLITSTKPMATSSISLSPFMRYDLFTCVFCAARIQRHSHTTHKHTQSEKPTQTNRAHTSHAITSSSSAGPPPWIALAVEPNELPHAQRLDSRTPAPSRDMS